MTESWLNNSMDKTFSKELVHTGYRLKQVPRPWKMRGGGVAIIYKSNIYFKMLTSSSGGHFSTFEHNDCNEAINKYTVQFSVIYRPPPSQKKGLKTNDFLGEWPIVLSQHATVEKKKKKPIIIVSNLNSHLDKPHVNIMPLF